ncbi:MAG: hypothetical protein HDS82_06370 [Bacteroidales bacterium]|nr:hypothetical protein [Bacteroidales bacterium]
MRKLFLFLLTVLAGATLTGCSQEDLEINDSTTETVDQGHYVSLDQALINLMPYYNEAAGTTRSTVLPLVTNLERLPVRNQTRSSGEVAPYYIVNFADNSGFAVLSADDRLLPVYAFSTSGEIALEDTVTNPTLSYFFNNLLQQEADNVNINEILPVPGEPYLPATKLTIIAQPLLSEQVSLWNQESPYNDYCPNKYLVGCTALSIAQICSYFGKPQNFQFTENRTTKTIDLDWTILRNAKSTDKTSTAAIAKFLAYLGSKPMLNMTYGSSVSYIKTDTLKKSMPRTMQKLGFSRCEERKYNVQGAITLLKDSKIPLFIKSVFGTYTEKDGKEVFTPYKDDGHVFIIDGIASKTLIVNNPIKSDPTLPNTYSSETFYYVHCVWGQKNHSNGYFYNPIYPSKMNILPPYSTTIDGLSMPSGWEVYTNLQYYYVIQ